ncbi:MAG: hypothetical protein WA719_03120 [Thermoplasmata archaeon]
MAHRLAALSVAALLIVLALVTVVLTASPVASAPAVATPASIPAIPTIYVTPLDQFGDSQYTFEAGQGGRVYFSINDGSDDASVTVHIFDSNATRDGLTNPVATWTVNASSGSYLSTLHGLAYTLPATLVYGGTWNITASGAVGGNASTTFDVQTYSLLVDNPPVVLPGASSSIGFIVVGIPSGSAYTQVTSVNLTASYYDGATASYRSLALSQASFGAGVTQGTVTFLLPVNASYLGDIEFHAWANVTNNGPYSEEQTEDTAIATEYYSDVYFDCNCLNDVVLANSQVGIYVYPYMYSDEYGVQYAPGLTVTFGFWSGSTQLANSSIPGSPPTTLVTGANGGASILFVASPSVFSTTATDQVNISVLWTPSIGGSAPVYENSTEDFVLATNGTAGATIVATFSEGAYYGGQAGTANWTVISLGTGTGWNGLIYVLETDADDTPTVTFQYGLLTGTSGTISFTAPANYSGNIELVVEAHNQSAYVESYAVADVEPAGILLVASETEYNPGDTVQVTVQTEGPGFASATLYETTTVESDESLFSSGTITGGVFSIVIPKGVAPADLYVVVTAQSPTQGVFASQSLSLEEASGVHLTSGITTVSQYSDGSFQPGQTLSVSWSVSSYGPGALTTSSYVYLWDTNGWYGDSAPLAEVLTSSTSGTFQYTIPSGTGAGIQALYVEYDSSSNNCGDHCYSASQVSYLVNPSPSALSLELGAGSGLTVGWLILLVIVIIVALVLVLLIRRGRTPKSPTSTYTPMTGTMAPPAPAPSSPPPQQWTETGGSPPAGSSDSPPPLPPPGAQ